MSLSSGFGLTGLRVLAQLEVEGIALTLFLVPWQAFGLRSNPFLHCIFMGVYILIVGLLEETQRKDEEMETLQVNSILR